MAWARISRDVSYYNSGFRVVGATEFLADTEADIKDLPKDISIGSACTCIVEGSTFIFSPSKDWKKYGGVSIKAGEVNQSL